MMSSLPIEVLELVFSFLTNRDLEHVVLVSRLWREVGENPMLWSWGCVRHSGDLTEARIEEDEECGNTCFALSL